MAAVLGIMYKPGHFLRETCQIMDQLSWTNLSQCSTLKLVVWWSSFLSVTLHTYFEDRFSKNTNNYEESHKYFTVSVIYLDHR